MNNVFKTNTDLIVRDTGRTHHGRELWELHEPLEFSIGNGFGFKATVPKGFVTDFASIPRWLWPIFPPYGRYAKAAVLHDYLYRIPDCSRFFADAVFREAMAKLKVPFWKRVSIYYAVRFFGGLVRTKCTHEDLLDIFKTEEDD